MDNLHSRIPSRTLVGLVLILVSCLSAQAEVIRFTPVSRETVEHRLGRYSGNNQQRETTLKSIFTEAGCSDKSLSEQNVKGSKIPNLICILPGASNRTIIVGAHFDRAPNGDGVVDNWSGASLLPSLLEAIKVEPRRHTYIFIGFTDEEKGEVGSRFYVDQMSKSEVALTDAMVNMDTLGLAPAEIWVSHSDTRLVNAFASVANQLKVQVMGVNVEQVGSSDAEQFAKRKIPRITIHSLSQESWNARILHTSRDKISSVHLDDYYETYHVLAAYLAYLDQTLADVGNSR